MSPVGPPEGRDADWHSSGLGAIESVLGGDARDVLGLYIYTASAKLEVGIRKNPHYRNIQPHLIGLPAILTRYPGISQAQVARLLGAERATIGLQVRACIRKGWVRRTPSPDDGRKYILRLTESGQAMVREARQVIAEHESRLGSNLSAKERQRLKRLLAKLIVGGIP